MSGRQAWAGAEAEGAEGLAAEERELLPEAPEAREAWRELEVTAWSSSSIERFKD